MIQRIEAEKGAHRIVKSTPQVRLYWHGHEEVAQELKFCHGDTQRVDNASESETHFIEQMDMNFVKRLLLLSRDVKNANLIGHAAMTASRDTMLLVDFYINSLYACMVVWRLRSSGPRCTPSTSDKQI